MHRKSLLPIVASVLILVATGCDGDLALPGAVDEAPVIDVPQLAEDATVSSGNTYRIEYTVDDPDDDAVVSIFADGDGDPATTNDQYPIVLNQPGANGAMVRRDPGAPRATAKMPRR